MDFEKMYNTYKEVDDILKAKNEGIEGKYKTDDRAVGNSRKHHYFLDNHPSELYT